MMELVIVAFIVLAAGVLGYRAGRAHPAVQDVVVAPPSESGRFRVKVGDRVESGDSAFAAGRITRARKAGEHGQLFIDGKPAKEF